MMRLKFAKGTLILAVSLSVLGGCTAGGYQIINHEKTIDILIESPDSHKVIFFSSLDGFRPHPAERDSDKRWVISAPADREFTYFFLVDGEHYIPPCRLKESDGYGNRNCVYSPWP